MILDLNLPTGQSTNNVGIIHKVLHTRTVISIYPNGQVYTGKVQSWLEGFTPSPKKKKSTKLVPKREEKRTVEVKETVIGEAEEY